MLPPSHIKGANTLFNSLQGVFWGVGRGFSHFVFFALMVEKVECLCWAVPQVWED